MSGAIQPELLRVVIGVQESTFRERYTAATARCWSPRRADRRFAEFDSYRAQFAHGIWDWLFGANQHGVDSLTALAWKMTHEINDGGRSTRCLDWSDKKQRLYLGDGLMEYLGLLKDEVKRVYEGKKENL